MAVPADVRAVSFTAAKHHPVGDGPHAVVANDFDGDADPDLAIANTNSYDVSVLLGGAGASFGTATAHATGGVLPLAIATADFDADLDPDLAVAVDKPPDDDAIAILRGASGGTFEAPSFVIVGNNPGGQPEGVAVGDFNADLDTDLAVAAGAAVIRAGATDATFTDVGNYTTGSRPQGIAVGRFDAGTDPDLAVVNKNDGNVSVLLGSTDATFGPAMNYSVLTTTFGPDSEPEIAASDLDQDGDLDLVVAGHGRVHVLAGDGAGNFGAAASVDVGVGPGSLAIGDLDGDADPDVAVANAYSGDVSVLLGSTGTSFAPEARFAAGDSPSSIAIADFNDDDDDDLVTANSLADDVAVLLNRAHAPEAPVLTGTTPPSPANDNAPKVTGSAPPGTTVRIFTTPDCSGAAVATGSAASFASPGLTVPVADDSTTTLRATATNAADVPSDCSSSSSTYVEHSSPPVAALSVSPNPALTGLPVKFDASATTGFGISRYEWDLDGNGSFELDTGTTPTATRAFGAVGDLSPAVRVSNDIGAGEARAPLSVRLAPPPGPLGVSIERGAQFVNHTDVTITGVWPPLARTMLVSNDGGFASPGRFAVAAETQWTLDSSGPERLPKTVYVRFDESSQTFTDDIILDETAPTIESATVTPTAGGSAQAAKVRKRSYRVRIAARDQTSGVRGLQVTTNRRRPGRLRTYKRSARLRKTVRVRTASPRIYVRVRDAAGNYSRWRRARRR